MTNQTSSGNSELDLPPLEWTLVQTGQSILFGSVVITSILGNFLVLYAFLWYSQDLRQPTHYFLANLSLADFCVGVFSLPYLAIFSITLRWYFGSHFCHAWTIMHFTFCASSILSTLAICVERFIGVRSPLTHLRIMNKRLILGIMLATWILSMILSAVPLFIWPESPSTKPLDCKVNLRKGHVITASVGIFHIPATAMVIFYYLIYRSATSNRVKVLRGNVQNVEADHRRKEIRLAIKLSFLVGFLIISYLPMFTVFLILGFNPTFVSLKVFILLAWIRYFNSCINPIIYAFSVPGYRKAFKTMFSFCSRGKREGIDDQSKNSGSSFYANRGRNTN